MVFETSAANHITKPALLRLLRRAGVKRVKLEVYDQARTIMDDWVSTFCKNVVEFTRHSGKKTVSVKYVSAALETMGVYLGAGLNNNASHTASLESFNSRGKPAKKTQPSEESRKPHRFHPGTVALRDIKHHQKNSDCLAIPKQNFKNLIRGFCNEIAQDSKFEGIRFEGEVFGLIQLSAEEYLISLFSSANLCAVHAHRETIFPEDLNLVLEVKNKIIY